jgi:type IV pilus assembly protein PilQ
VKPQITPDGNVIMDVDVNKDAVGQNTTAGPSIDTKHVRTSVLVENGGTVVIGGIYTQEDTSQVNKIPFFGDLPYIGPLFRNYYRQDNKTELLVFLTPRVVDDRLSIR